MKVHGIHFVRKGTKRDGAPSMLNIWTEITITRGAVDRGIPGKEREYWLDNVLLFTDTRKEEYQGWLFADLEIRLRLF